MHDAYRRIANVTKTPRCLLIKVWRNLSAITRSFSILFALADNIIIEDPIQSYIIIFNAIATYFDQ
jgi:hypothetical protein